MKRFWLVMLSLGLVLAFSAQAFAVDVKFSGSFYAAGVYLDKTSLRDTNDGSNNISTAFYYQRLRVGTEFIVSPGLKLVTRFDAMERIWGSARSAPGTTADSQSAGTRAENENIAFDHAYIQYDSPIGTFRVGYMNDGAWGTVFMDTSVPRGKIAWSDTTGPWYYTLQIVKSNDNSYTATNPATTTDADVDKYVAAVKYSWSGGEAGILGGIGRDAHTKPTANFYTLFYTLQPYAIVQLGPVKIQAEIDYFWGDWQKFDSGSGNVKMDNLAAFLDATADFGMVYAGGTFAYISGDDPTTTDKVEGNSVLVSGGLDWNPCLILFNSDRTYWAGAIPGYNGTQNPNLNDVLPGTAPGMTNAWFLQGRAGVRPIAALDIMASLSYAQADKKPLGVINDLYGWEVDVTGTYKLTNNLSYMLGVGYLFTGDYYKGNSNANAVNNNYILINKLTLTF
jgi:hypothetical protein